MSLSAIERKIAELTAAMQAAVEREAYEEAARLRDSIAELRGEAAGAGTPAVRKPPPGQMGLGTNVPVVAPPKDWTPPKKPDLLTSTRKGRGRR